MGIYTKFGGTNYCNLFSPFSVCANASRPGRHWPWNCGTAEVSGSATEDSDLKLTTLDHLGLLSSAGETVGETSQAALERSPKSPKVDEHVDSR